MKIHTLDLQFQDTAHTIASYLIEGETGLALIETGPGSTLNHLIEALDKHGYQPNDIKHVLLTHIHFDHAGAAGWWAQQGAQIFVHHFGARHLISPEKLIASATRIYGDDMERLWGDILPAPAENVTALHDGDIVQVGDLQFVAMETQGHARHHHSYILGDVAFTGDSAGLRIPEAGMADLPAPPPEFDRETWLETLDRLEAKNFTSIYPTHFGRIDDIKAHLDEVRQYIHEATEFVKTYMDQGETQAEILPRYQAWHTQRAQKAGLSEYQIHQYQVANPLDMSVTGIMRYWRKRAEGTT